MEDLADQDGVHTSVICLIFVLCLCRGGFSAGGGPLFSLSSCLHRMLVVFVGAGFLQGQGA